MVKLLLIAGLITSPVFAAIPKGAPALVKSLKQDLGKRTSRSFEDILKSWESRHGTQAVEPLISIVSDLKNSDPDRYVALIGVANLGGKSQAPRIAGFLRDKSWMIRSGSLRILGAFQDPTTAQSVLPLMRDPALVVRLEAVQTVEKLRPAGAEELLVAALHDEKNYHAGKAQWVPQRALSALVSMKARDSAPKLLRLLGRATDPDLQRRTVQALEALTGKRLKNGKPLPEQVASWKAELSK
jgi:HEAT repeat protein